MCGRPSCPEGSHSEADLSLWDKAVTYLRQAGAKAFVRSANREAVAYFEQALTTLTHLPETRELQEQAIDLRFDRRNALLPLAEFGRLEAYLREAEALAGTLDDQRRLGLVSIYMGNHHLATGGHATEMHRFMQRVEAIAETIGDVPLRIAANTTWSRLATYRATIAEPNKSAGN